MLCFVFAALVVLLDQLFKRWIVITMAVDEEQVLIRGLVNLYHKSNSGAAFSILPDHRWLLAAIAFIAAIVLIAILLRYNEGFWGTLGLASVLGGAVGNLIDRVFHGYVVDMFRFTFIDFAIFNIADIFITLGMITFCIFFIISSFKSGGSKEDAPEPEPDEYDDAFLEQYKRKSRTPEPQAPEEVDYSKLFYGDSAPDGYPDTDFSLPPEYFDQAPTQDITQEQNSYHSPDAQTPGYNETVPELPDYYDPEQDPRVNAEPMFEATANYEPEGYDQYEPVLEPPVGRVAGPDASSSLNALSELESELGESDLLADYNIDDILREYGFEDDNN